MSRIGKKPIVIPAATEVTVAGSLVSVTGPLGEIKREFTPAVSISVEDNKVLLTPKKKNLETAALWGTYASHIQNMVNGVNKAFEKKLVVEGIGFKVEVKGAELVLALGFTHPVTLSIPVDLKVKAEKNVITISGVNKESVGQFAAVVRSKKVPEPYKGKGIHYDTEVVRRKQGKKTA